MMEMLPLKRGVLHIVVTAPPPRLSDMRLADALVLFLFFFFLVWPTPSILFHMKLSLAAV